MVRLAVNSVLERHSEVPPTLEEFIDPVVANRPRQTDLMALLHIEMKVRGVSRVLCLTLEEARRIAGKGGCFGVVRQRITDVIPPQTCSRKIGSAYDSG